MNDVVFARVDPELKAAVAVHAEEKGMTLANAVADLLTRGLESAHEEAATKRLEQTVADTRLRLAETSRRLEEERARSAAAQEREESYRQFIEHLDSGAIGRCPHPGCGQGFTAMDLVGRRACRSGHPLTEILEKAARAPGMVPTEAMLVAGGLSLLFGLIAGSSTRST